MGDIASLGITVKQDGITEADKSLERLAKTGRKTEEQFDAFDEALKRSGKSEKEYVKTTKAANDATGQFGRNLGQAGIQVQQFVGQVQGGTDALLALSQQGADLGIVLGAPLVGVAVSLAAAIGIVATGSDDAASAIDTLTDSAETLDEITERSSKGVLTLSDSILELALSNKEAAEAELILAKATAIQAIAKTTDAVQESASAVGLFEDSWIALFDDLEDADEQFARLTANGLNLVDMFGSLTPEIGASVGDLTDLRTILAETQKDLGLNAIEARKLTQAFFELRAEKSAENVDKLNTVLLEIVKSSGGSNAKLLEFSKQINSINADSQKAQETLDLLNEQFASLDSVVSKADQTIKQSGIQDFIVDLSAEASLLGASATDVRVYEAALLGATDAQIESVRTLSEAIEKYKQEQNALKESERAQEKRAKLLEREARANERRTETLDASTQKILSSLKEQEEVQFDAVQNQIIALGEAREEQLITEQQFQDASTELWSQYYNGIDKKAQISAFNRQQVEARVAANNLASLQTATQTLTQFLDEGSALGKAAFIANQALSAALVFNQTQVAAASALAPPPIGLGPVAGAPLAASIEAKGLISALAIGAQTVAGLSRAQGGDFSPGQTVLVGERGPELVKFDQPGAVATNSALQQTGGSGNVTIQQNITVSGSGDKALEDGMRQAARAGAREGYQMVLNDFKQNGNIKRTAVR